MASKLRFVIATLLLCGCSVDMGGLDGNYLTSDESSTSTARTVPLGQRPVQRASCTRMRVYEEVNYRRIAMTHLDPKYKPSRPIIQGVEKCGVVVRVHFQLDVESMADPGYFFLVETQTGEMEVVGGE